MSEADSSKNSVTQEKQGPHPVNQKALRRLKNVAGQVKGIERMIEEEKYCVDILTQISAARAALNGVAMLILRRHIDTCVSDAISSGGEEQAQIIEELINIFTKEGI